MSVIKLESRRLYFNIDFFHVDSLYKNKQCCSPSSFFLARLANFESGHSKCQSVADDLCHGPQF